MDNYTEMEDGQLCGKTKRKVANYRDNEGGQLNGYEGGQLTDGMELYGSQTIRKWKVADL